MVLSQSQPWHQSAVTETLCVCGWPSETDTCSVVSASGINLPHLNLSAEKMISRTICVYVMHIELHVLCSCASVANTEKPIPFLSLCVIYVKLNPQSSSHMFTFKIAQDLSNRSTLVRTVTEKYLLKIVFHI